MAADDDERGPAPDPWDEIVAEGLGDEAGEITFQFEETSVELPPPAAEPADPGPPAEAAFAGDAEAAETPAPADGPADDMLQDWLTDGDSGTPPLAVFDPEDAAAGSSHIDIGTGGSGIALHGETEQEEIGTADGIEAVESSEWSVGEESPATGFGDEAAAGAGGAAIAAGAAAASGAAPAKTVRRPAKPAKKKGGGIGQMIGVVLGGLMAIPITLAILIYGLGKDPFGVTKKVPAEAAFLLPEKFRPGYKKPRASAATAAAGADADAGSGLDSLPTPTEPPESVAGTDAPAEEPATLDPPDIVTPDADIAVPDAAVPPATDLVSVDVAGLDDLGAKPATPALPVPPRLDMAALDEAVRDAAALGEALGAVDDTQNGAYGKLRTRWYRALARVAEELVAVENSAATSGRPLAGAPDNLGALHEGIGRRERLAAELAALAPDWLAYAKRGSDGIVVPVTFESARRLGPYWKAKVSLTGPDGRPMSLTVISRREPAAITGDRVVVTGVALDGDAIWAADVRAAAADQPPAF
ncbi:MAG: hypothetical protein ACKOSQ_03180 [Planctomycetaceae bacterium]